MAERSTSEASGVDQEGSTTRTKAPASCLIAPFEWTPQEMETLDAVRALREAASKIKTTYRSSRNG